MKIKMRPEDADASSTSEWATMSGRLAELREDGQAGIDALGRMTCPRCQQTSASFRATRPVVPWDRATAITMAARAAARPGYRNTGSVPRPNGRGTRRPASGRR